MGATLRKALGERPINETSNPINHCAENTRGMQTWES